MILVAGCGSDPAGTNTPLGETDVQELDLDGYDGVSPLRARVEGLQLAVRPAVRAVDGEQGTRWQVAFEVNRPLASVMSYGADGELGRCLSTDDYRFVLALDAAELDYVLAGEPVYLLLLADGGARREYGAMVRLAPRLAATTGSLLIWLEPAVRPVAAAEGRWFRGQAAVASRIARLQVTATGDGQPERIAFLGDGRWQFDWRPDQLLELLQPGANWLHFEGQDEAGQTYQLRAAVQVMVEQLGLTTADPAVAWDGAL